MSLAPLVQAKPRMTLDEFRQASKFAKVQASTAMDAFSNASARLGWGTGNMLEGTAYPFNRLTLNYTLMTSLYRGNWIIRKIVDALADDMTKNWVEITSEATPERIDRFEKCVQKTGTVEKINHGIKWSRLYGGAIAVIVLKGDDNFRKPLLIENVDLDSYRGLLVFDRWSGVSPSTELITDIEDTRWFGYPEYYQITTDNAKTYEVHHSRVMRFSGPLLPNWEWQANMRWGASVVEAMFEELKKRDNTSHNIASLIFRANIFEMKNDQLSQMLSGLGASAGAAQRFYQAMEALNQIMSNQGIVVTGKEGSLSSHQYGFAGLSDMYQQFMLDICGATEYPMSRLFGRSSSGLSGTNEGDEHSYYELVAQRQRTELASLDNLLRIIAMSEWGKIPKDFDWKWNPVRALSNEEQAELASKKTTAVEQAFSSGIVGRKTALMELKQQSDETGLFSNITQEIIDEADDEPVGGDMMGEEGMEPEEEPSATDMLLGKGEDAALDMTDGWEEHKHSRAGKGQTRGKSKGGQFVSKGGGGSSAAGKKSGGTKSDSREKVVRGVKGKHPDLGTERARAHLGLVEQAVKHVHPDWDTKKVAGYLKERYLPHIKEKAEAEVKHEEENGGKEMPAARINSLLKKPEAQAKAISAYGHDRRMGSIASTVGLPRNKAARGALRKMLRKAGVYKENGGWEKSGKVDVGFAANLVGKLNLLEDHLRSTPITDTRELGGGVNVTRVVIFKDGSKGVFKPHSGEAAGMRYGIITDGYQTERETSAWEVAKLCGMDDLVTPCVERVYEGERGAVLEFQQGKVAAGVEKGKMYDGEKDMSRMAIFDFVIGNTDRHRGNWMVSPDGKLRLIDHGLAFPEVNGRYRNGALDKIMYDQKNGGPHANVPFTRETVQPFLDNADKMVAAVRKSGMPARAANAMKDRLTKLGAINNWEGLRRAFRPGL